MLSFKKFFIYAIVALGGISELQASPQIHEVSQILSDKTTELQIPLNSETVRCSDVGYGALELKVSVPGMEYFAHFNHANLGENAPCVSAGRLTCGSSFGDEPTVLPSHLIDPKRPEEKIKVRLVLTQNFILDLANETCATSLREDVETNIRGTPFTHLRSGVLGDFPYEICKMLLTSSLNQ